MNYFEWKRNNYCIRLSYDYNTLLDLHNSSITISFSQSFYALGFIVRASVLACWQAQIREERGGWKAWKGEGKGFLNLSPQFPLFSPSSQSPTLMQVISPHSYELFPSGTLLVTRPKLSKEENTNKSTVWLVPNTRAQPYIPGSRNKRQLFRLY